MKCLKCPIALGNNFHNCPRQGDENDILFIGEAPGHTENKTKIPFTGKSGLLLKSYVALYQLGSFSTYSNVIKCQPPKNRDPSDDEIRNCMEFLIKDIVEVKAKLIILTGKVPLEVFKGEKFEFVKNHINKPFAHNGVITMAIYHPSYILRESKEELYFESFNIVSDLYNKINPFYRAKKFNKK